MSDPAFYDISWLAVPGRADAALLTALGLSDPQEVPWSTGIGAVTGDYLDPDGPPEASLSRVLVVEVTGQAHGSTIMAPSKQAHEWTLFIGGWFGDDGRATRVTDICLAMSRLRGSAFAFTSQGRMDWYAFAAARNGKLTRRFVWESGPIVDEGNRRPEEDWEDVDPFLEPTVAMLATSYAAGPNEIDEIPPDGSLMVTFWGRARGVPRRSLVRTAL